MKRTLSRPALTLAASTLGLGLVLSGCGAGGDTPEDVEGQTGDPNADSATSAAADDRPTTSTDRPTDEQSAAGGQGISNIDAVETAIATAEGEGGVATSIDSDDDGTWDVTAIDGETKFEYTISADGSTVEKTEEEKADADDQEEVGAADISLLEAINAVGESHQGEFDDAELDKDRDTVRYEISLQGEDKDYHVDAASGEVTEEQ